MSGRIICEVGAMIWVETTLDSGKLNVDSMVLCPVFIAVNDFHFHAFQARQLFMICQIHQ